nr:hypothetical protein [Tanacetum cinerariifolium]
GCRRPLPLASRAAAAHRRVPGQSAPGRQTQRLPALRRGDGGHDAAAGTGICARQRAAQHGAARALQARRLLRYGGRGAPGRDRHRGRPLRHLPAGRPDDRARCARARPVGVRPVHGQPAGFG